MSDFYVFIINFFINFTILAVIKTKGQIVIGNSQKKTLCFLTFIHNATTLCGQNVEFCILNLIVHTANARLSIVKPSKGNLLL